MDEIICYTGYVPYGEEREITFMELLLDDNLANGELECPEKVYADIGNRNHKLTANSRCAFRPDFNYMVHAGVNLASGVVKQQRVQTARVKR